MHSGCSSPPNSNYIANNNGQQQITESAVFHNSQYVMPEAAQQCSAKNNNSFGQADQDISHIVEQLISMDATNPFRVESEPIEYNYRDGLETLLCHNCGALMKNKTEMCRQCGADIHLGFFETEPNTATVEAKRYNIFQIQSYQEVSPKIAKKLAN